jgi:hypothetical protein
MEKSIYLGFLSDHFEDFELCLGFDVGDSRLGKFLQWVHGHIAYEEST